MRLTALISGVLAVLKSPLALTAKMSSFGSWRSLGGIGAAFFICEAAWRALPAKKKRASNAHAGE